MDLDVGPALAIGLNITDFGDSAVEDLNAEVTFLDGSQVSYTAIAEFPLPGGNGLFWGIDTGSFHEPFKSIRFNCGSGCADNCGIDEVYLVLAPPPVVESVWLGKMLTELPNKPAGFISRPLPVRTRLPLRKLD